MTRLTFNDFKRKALQKLGVRREYDTLAATYRLRKQLIEIRSKEGLTQEELENYEDLKDLREAKEGAKHEESISLSKVINDLYLE